MQELSVLCAEIHVSRAFLETTNAITFTDEDMKVKYLDHRKPLYIIATINGAQIRTALANKELLSTPLP